MKRVPFVMFAIALALIAYGYWGAFTEAGNKVYDEMNGYYPFFMLITGTLLFITGLIILLVRKRKTKK